MPTTVNHLGAAITFSAAWWNFITSTRIFVESFIGHSFGDPDLSCRIAMTVHELLENASKYSVSPDSPVQCEIAFTGTQAFVRVSNAGRVEDIAVLREELAQVMEGDPLETYLQKMAASVTHDKSQIGLARIRYEGRANLGLTVEGGLVIIEAQFDLPERTL